MAGVENGKKYKRVDLSKPHIRACMDRVLAGELSIGEGGKIIGANRECFRVAVKKERERLELEAKEEVGVGYEK